MFARGGWWRIRGAGYPRQMRVAAPVTTLSLVVGLTMAVPMPALAASAHPVPSSAYAITDVKTLSTTHKTSSTMTIDGKSAGTYATSATALPAASSGSVTLSASGTASSAVTTDALSSIGAMPKTPISGTPLWAQRTSALTDPSAVTGTVASQSLAKQLGVTGVVFSLSGSGSAGKVRIGLDYTAFKDAYGANFGTRLELYILPACALTTPQLAACRVRTPVSGAENDVNAYSLSGVVQVPGTSHDEAAHTGGRAASEGTSAIGGASPSSAPGGNNVVLAASSGTGEEGGATGNYAASTISPDGSWAAGGSDGDFTYNYSITTPSSSSSLTPKVSLDYDSGSVDGKTSMTNAQSSVVGDGWSTPDDNSITQTFAPCDDDPEGTASGTSTSDMCYDGEILTLSLNGSSTEIVDDGGTFRLQNDNGAVITHVTDSGKGQNTYNTDYWKITERDGTSYYFGLNELPGYASGDTPTNSVDWEPVYSAHSGSSDPCYSSTWADSVCDMAYQWHLDYVTDIHGDAMSYYYKQDTNYYGADNGASEKEYIRDSYLQEIDYGYTTATGPYATIPDKVVFTTPTRCLATTCAAPSSSMSTGTAANEYPDVPTDLICASGATCTSYAPSFFSTVRLSQISTVQNSTSGTPDAVDSYALAQEYMATGDSSSGTLWLSSITHTGDDTTAGASTVPPSEPSVEFGGTDLPNRWDIDTYPGLFRWRISAVTSELGSKTSVSYEIPDSCASSTLVEPTATPSSNTTSCYPVYWTPSSSEIEDWFIKYAVQEVTVTDETGGAAEQETQYSYGSPAWHYDDDPAAQAKYRTYGQFRGYQSVTTLEGNGTSDAIDKTKTSYYQGMYGDYLSPTTTRTSTVSDSLSGVHDDYDALSGQPLETDVYLGDSNTLDKATIYSYWVSAATASQALTGLPTVTAQTSATAETYTQQLTTDGGTTGWDYTETDDTYDQTTTDANFGLKTYEYSHAWTSSSTVDTDDSGTDYSHCTSYAYAPANTSLNLVGLVTSTTEVSVACSQFTEGSIKSVPNGYNTLTAPAAFTQDEVVSATLEFYDQAGSFVTSGITAQSATPTVGNETETAQATGYADGTFTYEMSTERTYDSYGRVEDSYDADGNETSTSYTVTDGLTTAEKVENALGQITSETLDPTRGLVLTSTDANGIVTTKQYDTLGRVTAEWDYSRATSTPANYKYAYTESDTGLSGSVTETMNDAEGYTETATIDDSLGRIRQTQANTPAGGILVTDTFYNSLGQVSARYNSWWDSSASATPSMTLVDPDLDSDVDNWDQYVYDGVGNEVEDQSMTLDDQVYSTTYTVDSGDATTVVPPTGGAEKTSTTDPLGRTSSVTTYSADPTLVTPSNVNTGYFYITGGTALTTSYTYDGHGNQATTEDPDNQTWTNVYNLLGQLTEKEDPTAGDSFTAYDPDGNVLQTEDSRGDYVSYTYDALGRKTAEYDVASTDQSEAGAETAAWLYDNQSNLISGMTDPIGHLTTEYTYNDGNTYTTQYLGFNVFGESKGERYTFPSSVTGLAGTYVIGHTYSTNTGLPATTTYGPGGSLTSAETVSDTYTNGSGFYLPAGVGEYAQNTTYDAYGRVENEEIGSATTGESNINDYYTTHTGDLQEQLVTNATKNIDQTNYTYDASGNTTEQTEERENSTSDEETQCYQYNALDELATAWTSTDACAAPTSGSSSNVGNTLGNNSAYWESWTYDDEGNRLTQDQHSLTNSVDDQITKYTYSSTQPNTLASTETTINGSETASTSYGYDTAGDTNERTTSTDGTQTLDWNKQGQLDGVSSTTNGASGYVYDAEGDLLVETDSATNTTTIYLPNEQFSYNTGNGTTSSVRYYALPGGGTAVRTGTGNSYSFEIGDQHGTNDLALDYTAQTPTWRQFDPYGNARGTSVTWIDNRTYLDKVTDAETGLTDDGARWYDPTLGRFTSLDPVFEATDTLALGGYGYTDANPVTQVDPSGDMPTGCTGSSKACNGTGGENGDSGGTDCTTYGPWPVGSPCDPGTASPGNNSSTASTSDNSSTTSTNDSSSNSSSSSSGCSGFWDMSWSCFKSTGKSLIGGVIKGVGTVGDTACNIFSGFQYTNDCNGAPSAQEYFTAHGVDLNDAAGQTGQFLGSAMIPGAGELGPADSITDDAIIAAKTLCGGESFTAKTHVITASGVAVAISALHDGEKVKAVDTTTGKSQIQTVQAVLLHYDTDLYDLKIHTADGSSVIHTTSNHLFWDVTKRTWIEAAKLAKGDRLLTADGAAATASGGIAPAVATGWMWDLTISNDHDFYVVAGSTAVLVHNCPSAPGEPSASSGSQWTTRTENAGDLSSKYTEGQATRDPASQWYHEMLSNDELLSSINDADDGDGIVSSNNNIILGGNHRFDELLTRVNNGLIDPNAPIQIQVYGGE